MEENQNKTTGILVTVGIHALIVFLLFILPGFKSDIPGGGEGIEVSLGGDYEGGNSNTMADLGSDNTTPPPPQEQSGDNSIDNVATDDNSDSKVALPEKNKKVTSPKPKTDQKTTTKTKTETKATERKVDDQSTFKKKPGSSKGNEGGDPNSSGYGGNKDGNRGKDNGDPSGNPDGDGGDTGNPGNYRAGVDLKGRDAKSLPTIDNNFKYEGVLRLKITVDNDGNVVEVKVATGTTITDLNQRNKAIQQIKTQLRFNKANLADYSSGYYTIIYKKH